MKTVLIKLELNRTEQTENKKAHWHKGTKIEENKSKSTDIENK